MKPWIESLLIPALTCFVIAGCSAGASEGRATADVSGTITMGGQPLVDADVYFMSEDGSFVGRGTTNSNGEYRLVQGAALGPNTIFISKKTGEIPSEFQGDAESGMDEGQFAAMAMSAEGQGSRAAPVEMPEETIPSQFSDPEQSQLNWDVVEGGNEGVNFNL